MVLADLGAEVVRVVRPGTAESQLARQGHTLRRRTTVVADLKDAGDAEMVRSLVDHADVLVEGFRPGVAERLGLGPDELSTRNERLVYARMTGWGQCGPWAERAGHDINYISVTGALHAIGLEDAPVPPLNLVGDYGGGSMFLVTGVLAALVERSVSGQGQTVDAAMVDGTSVLLQGVWELMALGQWTDDRESNLLDGGAPFYRTYPCSDGRHIAVGAIEPQFYEVLLAGLGLADEPLPEQYNRSGWPRLRDAFAATFLTRTRDEWAEVFDGTDACVSPVLTFEEVERHRHMAARRVVDRLDSGAEAVPAPRFSRSVVGQCPAANTVRTVAEVREAWTSPEDRALPPGAHGSTRTWKR
jgi:alpha-methylacyl-CoA racemase